MTPELILSLMLAVGPQPGRSVYSVVRSSPDEPAPCQEARITCSRPWRDPHSNEWWRYESESEALERYRVIASAMAALSPDLETALLVLTITRHESGWRRDVHSGIGRNARGDDGRSWCLGQFHLGQRSEVGAELVGIDGPATRRCVGRIVSEVERFRIRCKGSARCVFVSYGSIGIGARMRTLARLREALR